MTPLNGSAMAPPTPSMFVRGSRFELTSLVRGQNTVLKSSFMLTMVQPRALAAASAFSAPSS